MHADEHEVPRGGARYRNTTKESSTLWGKGAPGRERGATEQHTENRERGGGETNLGKRGSQRRTIKETRKAVGVKNERSWKAANGRASSC